MPTKSVILFAVRSFAEPRKGRRTSLSGSWVSTGERVVLMARINVDDGLESRPEYRKLLKLHDGDDDRALGMLVRFWRLAQKYWGDGELVPAEDIQDWGFEYIIESKWGVLKERGVYAIGSEERFAWYRQKCEAGKARSNAPRDAGGKFTSGTPSDDQRSDVSAPPKPPLADIPIQPLSLAPVLVPSLSPSRREEKDLAPRSRKTAPSDAESPVSKVWEAYAGAYEARYGEPPSRNAMVNGQLAHFVKRIPQGESPEVAAFYVRHNDSFYVRSMHPVGLLLKDAEKLRTEWATGRTMTSQRARQVEQKQNILDVFGPAIAKAEAKERGDV